VDGARGIERILLTLVGVTGLAHGAMRRESGRS
jgi:hypothetical protein